MPAGQMARNPAQVRAATAAAGDHASRRPLERSQSRREDPRLVQHLQSERQSLPDPVSSRMGSQGRRPRGLCLGLVHFRQRAGEESHAVRHAAGGGQAQITLAFAVHRADPARRIGTLVFVNGTGVSSEQFVADRMGRGAFPAELINRFDIVGVDPRGGGAQIGKNSCKV